MVRILIDVPVEEAGIAALREISGVEVRVIPFSESARELPLDIIEDVDVLFCTHPPSNFSEMRRVRWIQIASSGCATASSRPALATSPRNERAWMLRCAHL